MGLSSSGILSFNWIPLDTRSRKSIFIAAVIGVNFPTTSYISHTFDKQCLRVKIRGIFFDSGFEDFLPLCFSLKFNSPISYCNISSLEYHLSPNTFMLFPSLDRSGGGWLPLNVKPFNENPPRARTTSNSSALWCAFLRLSSPLNPSSTYTSS